jgi:hypothetical protein
LEPDIIHNEFPELIGEKSNFYEYRKIALRWIQLLSGKEWTDYNAHDPGVTILEALCYTLTEIDYKLDFSIEEILVSSSVPAPFKLRDNAFYLAENILTSAPVTLNDYRRLIIDNVGEINNAWIIPSEESDTDGKNFEVLLLKKNQVILPEKAIEATENLLGKFNGYGRKPMTITVVHFEHIALHADIYIENEQHAENVLAEIFFNLNERILNVNPNRETCFELEEKGMDYNDIFDGPQMDNGIITKKSLSDGVESISLIRIKKILATTSGVEMINNLAIEQEFETDNQADDKIKFPKKINGNYYVPYFAPTLKNKIRIFKDQKNIEVNYQKIADIIKHKALKTKKDYVVKNQHKSATYKLNARDRNIHDYYSIRNDFPGLYGLKEKGFSLLQNQDVSNVDQLKAYLMPFEKTLEDSFMRLAMVNNLFSIHGSAQQSLNNRFLDNPVNAKNKNSFSDLIRRDQFLTHLLARFDVHFNDSFEMHIDDDEPAHLKKIILSKEKMLRRIDKITYNRSVYDYQNNEAISSLEKELYLRLTISEPPERPFYKAVSELKYTITEVDRNEVCEIGNESGVEFIENFNYAQETIGYHTKEKNILAALLKAGISMASYKIIESENKTAFYTILTDNHHCSETLISINASKNAALGEISILIEKFRGLSQASEGFYMIDHALLYNFDDDFTRFRMSFVFPSWSARFQNRSFQKQVENIVAKLVPAHISASCLWFELKKMTAFENAYSEWYQAFTESKTVKDLSESGQKKFFELSNKLAEFLKDDEAK